MSELTIKTILESGRKSLADKNYWSAFVVALSLPSMCSRIDYADVKYQGKDRNNGMWHIDKTYGKMWHDRKAYISWCEEWIALGEHTMYNDKLIKSNPIKDSFLVQLLGENYPEKLYKMRCNLLHEAETDIEHGDGLPIFFSIGIGNTQLSYEHIVNIEDVCKWIFCDVENWISFRYSDNLPVRRMYYDKNNPDDVLLYDKLCKNTRSDYLEKEHEKELKRRQS